MFLIYQDLFFILQMYMILIQANNFGKLFHIVWCRDIIIHFSHVFNPSTFISLFLFASVLSTVCTTALAESRRVFLDRDSSRMKLVIIVHSYWHSDQLTNSTHLSCHGCRNVLPNLHPLVPQRKLEQGIFPGPVSGHS